jgi:type IV secretion system protein VirB1
MGTAFVDIAQNCAPMVQMETLAAVVSLESKFQPFNIRINSGKPLAAQPASKAEAIEIATSLITDRQDIRIGLGGIGVEQLQRLNLSVSDAFDPCLNLKATATLLDGYYRLAQRSGRNPEGAETVMLQSYYERYDRSPGEIVRYDQQVRDEAKRLSSRLKSLVLVEPNREGARKDQAKEQADDKVGINIAQNEDPVLWDVFRSRRHSSVFVFQNNRSEQSE